MSDERLKVISALKLKYKYKGNIYEIMGEAKMKDRTTREWLNAIIYVGAMGIYVREEIDFFEKFKPISPKDKS